MEPRPGPRSGARDNGLRCAGYVSVGDLDPRVADSLLETLRAEGIAAYAVPTPASQGLALERQLPKHVTDRLYVDAEQADRAKELVGHEESEATPPPRPQPAADPDLDVDAAWQQLLTSLKTPPSTVSWPSRENVTESHRPAHLDDIPLEGLSLEPATSLDEVNLEEEHFVPPAPPPLPRLRSVTIGALATIGLGILVLVTGFGGGAFSWLAIAAIIGGALALIWHVRTEPPADSGSDDGAVV